MLTILHVQLLFIAFADSLRITIIKFDRIFIYQTSPVTIALTPILLSKIKKIKSSIWILDLWPETIETYKFPLKKMTNKILNTFCKFIYDSNEKILISSNNYLESLKKDGINFYAEPVSNDAGTAMGAAMLFYYSLTQTKEKKVDEPTLYLGPKRTYTDEKIQNICAQDGVELTDATNEEVVKIIQIELQLMNKHGSLNRQ